MPDAFEKSLLTSSKTSQLNILASLKLQKRQAKSAERCAAAAERQAAAHEQVAKALGRMADLMEKKVLIITGWVQL